MTLSIASPINLQAGIQTNPLVAGSWGSPSQVGAIVIYNVSPTVLSINALSVSKSIWPNTADVVVTGGEAQLSITPQTVGNVPIGTYVGSCPATMYDLSEDLPDGFPVPLPTFPINGNSPVAQGITIPSSFPGVIYVQPPENTTELLITNNGTTQISGVSVTGYTTGFVYTVASLTIQPGGTAQITVGAGDSVYEIACGTAGNNVSIYASQLPQPPILFPFAGLTTGTITVPTGTYGVVIHAACPSAFPTTPYAPMVVGHSAGTTLQYPVHFLGLTVNSGTTYGTWFVPTDGATTLTITWSYTPPGEWYAEGVEESFFADIDIPVVIVTIPNPAAGADWTYTLQAPARVVGFSSNFIASAGAASRYANLLFSSSAGSTYVFFPLNTTAITASQTAVISAGKEGAYADTAPAATLVQTNGPLPDIVLPAGAIIESVTRNIQAADQWEFLTLTLALA